MSRRRHTGSGGQRAPGPERQRAAAERRPPGSDGAPSGRQQRPERSADRQPGGSELGGRPAGREQPAGAGRRPPSRNADRAGRQQGPERPGDRQGTGNERQRGPAGRQGGGQQRPQAKERPQAPGRGQADGQGRQRPPGRREAEPVDVAAASALPEDEPAVWCDTCEEMVLVGDLDQDDCCPRCGERVGPRKVPLKFKLMIAATAIYLAYRAFQGITWVVHHA